MLNPLAIEKNKVGLPARVFGESTRNALTYYVKNGHPEWSGKLNFVESRECQRDERTPLKSLHGG